MNAVLLEGVTKTYGSHHAVNDLSLTVPAGSVYGFIGPNGSGKTTTLRMILHIIHPDSGVIEVLGTRGTRAASDRVGYLPEERGLYRKLTVRRQLAYYGTLKGMNLRDATKAATNWLDRLGLSGWADKKIEALSKGMGQKVQFISSVIARPELVILDEPFSGLDPVNLEVVREAIVELNQAGSTVIFSTHDMAMAERMCDFIFMIFRGRKVLNGTLSSIQAEYGSDLYRLRLSDMQVLHSMTDLEIINESNGLMDVRFSGESQELLERISGLTQVKHFEEKRPSLHEIFLNIAGPEAREVSQNA